MAWSASSTMIGFPDIVRGGRLSSDLFGHFKRENNAKVVRTCAGIVRESNMIKGYRPMLSTADSKEYKYTV